MRNRKGNRTRQERWQEVKLVWKNSLSLTGTLTYTMLHIYLHSHTHTHIHSSLLPQCFGQSGRVKIPKVIMKFNYNSLGNSMEMSSVPKGWESHSTAQHSSQVRDNAGNTKQRHDSWGITQRSWHLTWHLWQERQCVAHAFSLSVSTQGVNFRHKTLHLW